MFYCGLCHVLYDKYGNIGRTTLTYDLSFSAILLSSVYDTNDIFGKEHCPVHPIRKQEYVYNRYTEFAADMNLVMAYYKYLDDYHDDNALGEYRKARKLEDFITRIRNSYPEKMALIEDRLARISELESKCIYDPDLLANLFGEIMAELFIINNDEKTPLLKTFGFQLGKMIYIMDAYLDFDEDLKKQRFNPLTRSDLSVIRESLEMIMADCMKAYDELGVRRYANILESVLLSGIWMAYDLHEIKKERKRK